MSLTNFKKGRQNSEPFLDSFFLIDFKNGIKNHSTWADEGEIIFGVRPKQRQYHV